MVIDTGGNADFRSLNEAIRASADAEVTVNGCMGQRYIGAGLKDRDITVNGVPGNALGAFLDGASITVNGNAQDAVGDTMNDGRIVIRGNAGDAVGYSMRGGRIFVRGNVGYRAGIHMKAYGGRRPVMVVGGRAGSFLGEYQAGGLICVLGRNDDGLPLFHNFCGTGMHGGVMYLRCDSLPHRLPPQVDSARARGTDIVELREAVEDFCSCFPEFDAWELLDANFFVLTPDSANPYREMYTYN